MTRMGCPPGLEGLGCCRDLLVFEIGSDHFVPRGHMPCPDPFGILPHCLAQVIGRATEQHPRKLVLFGHADAEIFPEHDHDLSKCRGLAVRALLLQDWEAWKHAAIGADLRELALCLSAIAALMGWECRVGHQELLAENAPSRALHAFQVECIRRYRSPLLANGLPSVACWHGVFHVLMELVDRDIRRHFGGRPFVSSGAWRAPPLGFGPGFGVYPCGSSFSRSPRRVSDASRRVDLVFLPDDVPLRNPVDRSRRLTPEDVPIYDEQRIP